MTDVTPAVTFWEAEPEHQDYPVKNPNGYTCHYVRPSWRRSEGPAVSQGRFGPQALIDTAACDPGSHGEPSQVDDFRSYPVSSTAFSTRGVIARYVRMVSAWPLMALAEIPQ